MKKLYFSFMLILGLLPLLSAQEKEYNITIQVKGLKNEPALLAFHLNDKKYIKDTLWFNEKGIAEIKGKKSYEPGIYLVAIPSKNNVYFEFIMKETAYQITTDTSNFIEKMSIKNSPENSIFYDDIKNMGKNAAKVDSLRKIMNNDSLPDDIRENAEKAIEQVTSDMKKGRWKIINENPDKLYAKVLHVMADIELPEGHKDQDGNIDKLFAYFYTREHFLDGIDWRDSGLIRTPVLVPRVFRYLDEWCHPAPDSLKIAVDDVLTRSKVNPGVFQLMLTEIINKYAKSNIMGQEALYVHLVDNYYAKGLAPWTDPETLEKMKKRADELRPTLIGNKAPDLLAYDTTYKPLHLYEFIKKYEYTALVFWSSECGHCQKEMPELRRIWEDSLKQKNVGVFSISTEVDKDVISKFITEKKLDVTEGWVNGFDPTGRQPFRKQYDLISTPLLVLIYKDNTILAKRIPLDSLNDFIENHQKVLEYQRSQGKQ